MSARSQLICVEHILLVVGHILHAAAEMQEMERMCDVSQVWSTERRQLELHGRLWPALLAQQHGLHRGADVSDDRPVQHYYDLELIYKLLPRPE